MIISGGSNIYPREVEEVLLKHPHVREASVIGRPDPEWGEIVVAYVVGEARRRRARRALPWRDRPLQAAEGLRVRRALPKNNYGKILKTDLRELDAETKAKG